MHPVIGVGRPRTSLQSDFMTIGGAVGMLARKAGHVTGYDHVAKLRAETFRKVNQLDKVRLAGSHAAVSQPFRLTPPHNESSLFDGSTFGEPRGNEDFPSVVSQGFKDATYELDNRDELVVRTKV